jgi:hypothetical protein
VHARFRFIDNVGSNWLFRGNEPVINGTFANTELRASMADVSAIVCTCVAVVVVVVFGVVVVVGGGGGVDCRWLFANTEIRASMADVSAIVCTCIPVVVVVGCRGGCETAHV